MQKLSVRLQACADLVRSGARLADIGTDHGYVPVYLVQNHIVPGVVAADINEGPLASCRSLVSKNGYEKIIRCVLSDGLEQIEENEADDILISGMGGELIADILSRCPYVKHKHLILNPMTHPELARRWLFENGFEIQSDLIISEGRHQYSVFDASYTGNTAPFTEADCYLGRISDFSCTAYFEHLLNYLKNKQKGGADCEEVIRLIEEKVRL